MIARVGPGVLLVRSNQTEFREDPGRRMRMIIGEEISLERLVTLFLLRNFFELEQFDGTKHDDEIRSGSKKKLIKIIVPLIKIDNSDLQKVLGLYYDHISTSSDRTRDYSLFKAYLKKNKSKPPLELIGFMFEKSPDKAMMALLNSYLPRNKELALLVEKISSSKSEIRNMGLPYRLVRKKEEKGYDTIPDERWAEKCKEIKKNLYILSQYKEWWIKLYVSESIRKNPYFLETKTIEQLKKEEHPLVQKSLKEILSATN